MVEMYDKTVNTPHVGVVFSLFFDRSKSTLDHFKYESLFGDSDLNRPDRFEINKGLRIIKSYQKFYYDVQGLTLCFVLFFDTL